MTFEIKFRILLIFIFCLTFFSNCKEAPKPQVASVESNVDQVFTLEKATEGLRKWSFIEEFVYLQSVDFKADFPIIDSTGKILSIEEQTQRNKNGGIQVLYSDFNNRIKFGLIRHRTKQDEEEMEYQANRYYDSLNHLK